MRATGVYSDSHRAGGGGGGGLEVNFDYLPRRGWKREWKYGAGEGWRGLALSLLNFSKVYHFYI